MNTATQEFQVTADLQQDATLSELLANATTDIDQADKSLLLEAQSIVATKLLSASGWDIAKELFGLTYEMVDLTKLYVLPVLVEMALVQEKLGEHYPAFIERFNIFKEDLAQLTVALGAIHAKHAGRTGGVADEDQALVAEITLGYSTIQTQMETNVCPEMLLQMQMLEAAGIDSDVLLTAYNSVQPE